MRSRLFKTNSYISVQVGNRRILTISVIYTQYPIYNTTQLLIIAVHYCHVNVNVSNIILYQCENVFESSMLVPQRSLSVPPFASNYSLSILAACETEYCNLCSPVHSCCNIVELRHGDIQQNARESQMCFTTVKRCWIMQDIFSVPIRILSQYIDIIIG